MLSWFRKQAKSNWVKALYVTIAATFFGGFGILGNKYFGEEDEDVSESSEAVVVVNGETISAVDYLRAYNQAKQSWMARMEKLYGRVPEDMFDAEAMKQDVMEQMVNRALLLQEAKKMGVKVSSTDVNQEIVGIPYFYDEAGKFSQDRYTQVLRQIGMAPQDFEKEIEGQLKVNRVVAMVVAPVQVDEAELKDYYSKTKEQVDLSYFFIDAEKRYQNLAPTSEEIDQYYKNHLTEFNWPEMRKMVLLRFPIADYEKGVKVGEAELKEYYEKGKDRYLVGQEERRFRHILIKVEPNAPEAEVKKAKERAEKVLVELKEGGDFDAAAKKYSDDPGSAARGGDLGFQSRGYFIPEFEQAGYGLVIGELSPPVKSKFGYHVIMLDEIKPAEYEPFSKVRAEVKNEVARGKALAVAREKAEQVQKDAMKLGMGKAAQKYGLKLLAGDYFKKRDKVLDVPESADLTEQAFYMTKDEISDVVPGLDDFYIMQLTEISDPHQATLDEARSRIVKTLKPELQVKKAKEDGRRWLEEMRKGASVHAEAAKAGAKVQSTGFFEKGASMVPQFGMATEDFTRLVFSLGPKKKIPDDVYSAGSLVFVLVLKAAKPADMNKYEEDKEAVRQNLLQKKQQEAFDRFIEDKKQGKVKVVEAVYSRIE